MVDTLAVPQPFGMSASDLSTVTYDVLDSVAINSLSRSNMGLSLSKNASGRIFGGRFTLAQVERIAAAIYFTQFNTSVMLWKSLSLRANSSGRDGSLKSCSSPMG